MTHQGREISDSTTSEEGVGIFRVETGPYREKLHPLEHHCLSRIKEVGEHLVGKRSKTLSRPGLSQVECDV